MVLFVLIIIVLLNKYLYKSFLNPVFLQSLLWLVYYIILAANIDKYDVYIGDVQPFLLLQLVGFSLGGFISYLVSPKALLYKVPAAAAERERTLKNVQFCYPAVLIILLISLFFLIRQAGSASLFGIADLRNELVEDDGKKFGFLGTIQYLIAVYLVLYFSSNKKMEFRFIILLILFFYFTLLLGSRGMFLFFFLSLMYMLLWQKKLKKIYIFYMIAGLAAFFIALTYLREHNEGDDNLLLNMFLVYTVTSLPALVVASPKVSAVAGAFTFRNIYLWINKLGFSFSIVPILSEFTQTPLPTNVYTYMKPYYYDFGFTGVFLIPLLLGFASNRVYFRAAKGRLGSMIMISLLTYPLFMQMFDELYFLWFSNWLYFAVVIMVFTKFKIYEIGRSHRNISPVA